jgi:hypothetical protein
VDLAAVEALPNVSDFDGNVAHSAGLRPAAASRQSPAFHFRSSNRNSWIRTVELFNKEIQNRP